MNKLRKIASKWPVSLIMCVILLFFTTQCGNSLENIEPKKEFTGEELFRGIFLMQGEVASQISLFQKIKSTYDFEANEEVRLQYSKVVDELINMISTKHPWFFKDFKSAITSGDHFEVQNALNAGSGLLVEAMVRSPLISPYYEQSLELVDVVDTEGLVTRSGEVDFARLAELHQSLETMLGDGDKYSGRAEACSIVAVCLVWVYLAAAQSAAVAVNVVGGVAVAVYAAVALWVATYTWTSGEGGRISGSYELQKELLVNEISVKFAS